MTGKYGKHLSNDVEKKNYGDSVGLDLRRGM